MTIYGLFGTPAASRSNTGHMYTYINGRYVRDRVVQHAIMQGYRNVLERGRYPVLVMFIELPAAEVDVNVHPTKHEVRFREQTKIHSAIQSAIEEHLQGSTWLQRSGAVTLRAPATAAQSPSASRVTEVKEALLRYSAGQQPADIENSPPTRHISAGAEPGNTAMAETDTFTAENGGEGFSALRIIGQFRSAYILCQNEADLLIIDQHAAHERINFEKLRSSFRSGRIEGQSLLFPEPLALSPLESATLKVHAATLQRLGFGIDEFGHNTWLLTTIPRLLVDQNYRQSLQDILAELNNLGKSSLFEEKCEELLATVACHSSVRGEWHLSVAEIHNLLQQMNQTDFAANCPHGRPVVARIGLSEIEKMFKRT
jgi:DNA mismatch repair protein MutL